MGFEDLEKYLISDDGGIVERLVVDEGGCINEDTATCCGCGAMIGNYHELGCDHERCPNCYAQLISCDCTTEKSPDYNVEGAIETVINLTRALSKLSLAAAGATEVMENLRDTLTRVEIEESEDNE